MPMSLSPMVSTLRRHKLTALLLMLQVAFTCAIVCNVFFMVATRIERMSVATGIAEQQLSLIGSTSTATNANNQALHDADLAALRAMPGVQAVAAVNYSLPLGRSESSSGICPNKQALDRAVQLNSLDGSGCVEPSVYDGSPGLIDTLGLQLVAGRDFQASEYVDKGKPSVAIVTRALAEQLYPGQQALGQSMYDGSGYVRIVGIVKTLLRPNLRTPGIDGDSMISPIKPGAANVLYVLRSAPADRQRVLAAASATLLKLNPDRIIDPSQLQTYSDLRATYFQRDTTMIGLLLASACGLLFVSALGISGLANFWVQQRRRSIGIRRAIGAKRSDILRYFQMENLLVVGAGVVLGLVLAMVLNAVLMKHYELERLPLYYLPIGALLLCAVGQLSVLNPARRAAAVPPVVAMRNG